MILSSYLGTISISKSLRVPELLIRCKNLSAFPFSDLASVRMRFHGVAASDMPTVDVHALRIILELASLNGTEYSGRIVVRVTAHQTSHYPKTGLNFLLEFCLFPYF